MDWTVEFDDGPITAIDFSFEWDYSPSTPDVWYLRNGDPGYPGDPEEMEITEIESRDIKSIEFGSDWVCPGHCVEQWFFTWVLKWLNKQTEYDMPLYNRILDAVREEVDARCEYTGD
jgi:hypothetical protein